MALKNSLFRFMAVRPVNKAAPDDVGVIRPVEGPEPATPFQRLIRAAETQASANALAVEAIGSDAYVKGFSSELPLVRRLAHLNVATRERLRRRSEDFESRLREVIPQAPDHEELKHLEQLWNRVWDSLIAAYIAPSAAAHDRTEQMHLLRTIHWLRNFRAFESPALIRRALSAKTLIPTWVSKQPAPSEPKKRPPPTSPARDLLNKVNRLRGEFQKLAATRVKLDEVYWEEARERETKTPPLKVHTFPGRARAPVGLASDNSRAPWRMMQEVAKRLPPETVAVLDRLSPSWRDKSHSELAALISEEQSRVHRELVRLGGPRAAYRLTDEDPLDPGDITLPPEGTILTTPKWLPGQVRPAGMGDLLIVQEALLRYEEGQVAYIENVMQTESRNRVHRRLDREVQTVVTVTEEKEETERDLQSNGRYELAQEVEKTVASSQSLSIGVGISASYGPVLSVETSADFAVASSSEESIQSSSNYAQEIVESSVTKLSKTIKTELTQKTLSEVEETNTHGFDNTDGEDHVVGVYRYIDQVWESQLYNYGKRLMMEFIIPQPGEFYKYAQEQVLAGGIIVSPPPPLDEDFSFQDLTPGSYQTWVDRYRVADVSPPPPEFRSVTKIVDLPETRHARESNDYVLMTKMDTIAIPEGYLALEAWVYGSWSIWDSAVDKLHVHLGRTIFDKDATNNDDYKSLAEEEGVLGVGVYTYEVAATTLSIEVRCKRSDETLVAWQLVTYKKIVDAYNALQSAYEAHVANLKNVQTSGANDLPPEKKREIERTELKKSALVLLTGEQFEEFNAMASGVAPHGYPEFDIAEARTEGRIIQFREQCLEWEQLTYLFYPYFWGSKEGWVERSTASNTDALFEAFLRAGSARVLVPVRPGYESSLLYFLQTGAVWNGGEAPVLDDELYVSIVDELAEAQGLSLENAEKEGEPWQYTLPTELVKLQPDAELPSFEPEE